MLILHSAKNSLTHDELKLMTLGLTFENNRSNNLKSPPKNVPFKLHRMNQNV